MDDIKEDSSDEHVHSHSLANVGQSASAHQPARPNQEEQSRGSVNDCAQGLNPQQQREESANTIGNKVCSINFFCFNQCSIYKPLSVDSFLQSISDIQSCIFIEVTMDNSRSVILSSTFIY